jgi:hypothetical protein
MRIAYRKNAPSMLSPTKHAATGALMGVMLMGVLLGDAP